MFAFSLPHLYSRTRRIRFHGGKSFPSLFLLPLILHRIALLRNISSIINRQIQLPYPCAAPRTVLPQKIVFPFHTTKKYHIFSRKSLLPPPSLSENLIFRHKFSPFPSFLWHWKLNKIHRMKEGAYPFSINSIIFWNPRRFFARSRLYPRQKSANSPATFLIPLNRK